MIPPLPDEDAVPPEWKKLAEKTRQKMTVWHHKFFLSFKPNMHASTPRGGSLDVGWNCCLPACRMERKHPHRCGGGAYPCLSNPLKHYESASHLENARQYKIDATGAQSGAASSSTQS